jgi:hypothetical protein
LRIRLPEVRWRSLGDEQVRVGLIQRDALGWSFEINLAAGKSHESDAQPL